MIVLQAELRAIAARLVMPEFMLTSDASNASYASTMVAEGPAVRMFQADCSTSWWTTTFKSWSGLSPPRPRPAVCPERPPRPSRSNAVPPSLAVRDRLREAQADQILVRAGAMSRGDHGAAAWGGAPGVDKMADGESWPCGAEGREDHR